MTKMLNGKIVSTTLLSRDTYDAMPKIVTKGTKEEVSNPPITDLPQQTQPITDVPQENPETPTQTDQPEVPTTPETTGNQPQKPIE